MILMFYSTFSLFIRVFNVYSFYSFIHRSFSPPVILFHSYINGYICLLSWFSRLNLRLVSVHVGALLCWHARHVARALRACFLALARWVPRCTRYAAHGVPRPRAPCRAARAASFVLCRAHRAARAAPRAQLLALVIRVNFGPVSSSSFPALISRGFSKCAFLRDRCLRQFQGTRVNAGI